MWSNVSFIGGNSLAEVQLHFEISFHSRMFIWCNLLFVVLIVYFLYQLVYTFEEHKNILCISIISKHGNDASSWRLRSLILALAFCSWPNPGASSWCIAWTIMIRLSTEGATASSARNPKGRLQLKIILDQYPFEYESMVMLIRDNGHSSVITKWSWFI